MKKRKNKISEEYYEYLQLVFKFKAHTNPDRKVIGICVTDYLKFCGLPDCPALQPYLNNLNTSGYANVFKYSKELETYLQENEISYDLEYDV